MESSFDRDVMLVWVQIMTFFVRKHCLNSDLDLILCWFESTEDKLPYPGLPILFIPNLHALFLLAVGVFKKKCSYISVAKIYFQICNIWEPLRFIFGKFLRMCGVIFCFFFTRANDTSEFFQQSKPLGQTSLRYYTQEFIGRSNNYIGSHSKKWYLLLFFCLSSLWGIGPLSWHSQNALQRYYPGGVFLSFSQESVWHW